MKFTVTFPLSTSTAPFESCTVDPNAVLAEISFLPDDSLGLEVSGAISHSASGVDEQLHAVFINDGTNLLVVNATVGQLAHLWGQLGKALDEIRDLDNE